LGHLLPISDPFATLCYDDITELGSIVTATTEAPGPPLTEVTLAEIRELVVAEIGRGYEDTDTQRGRRRLLDVIDGLPANGPAGSALIEGRCWRIVDVDVAGLGGVGSLARPPLGFAPVPGITVVRGENGQGKTSLARGIEMALNGGRDPAREAVGDLWATEQIAVGAGAGRAALTLASGDDRLELLVELDRGAAPVASAMLTDTSGRRAVELPAAWARVLDGSRASYSYAALQSRLSERSHLQEFLEELLLLGTEWQAIRTAVELRATGSAAAAKAVTSALKAARDQETALASRFADDPRAPEPPEHVSWPTLKDGVDVDAWLAGTGQAGAAQHEPVHVAADHEARVQDLRDALTVADDLLRTAEQEHDTPGMANALGHIEHLTAIQELDGSRCPVCGSDTDWRSHVAALTGPLRQRKDAAHAVHGAVTAIRDWTETDLAPLLTVDVPGAPQPEVSAFRAVTSRGCHAHSEAHRLASALLDRLADDSHAAWLSGLRDTASATAEWRSELVTVVHRFADAVRESTAAAADAEPWKKAQDVLNDLQVRLRQSRQDAVTEHLRSALDRLLPAAGVELTGISHRGGAKSRRGADLELRMAGREAKPGMLSSGQRNALLLAPLVMIDAPGPFGFVVVDDPVHALDDTRVDLLAAELARLAVERQVIVLTHDPRLEEYLRARDPDMTVVEVQRDPQSQVVTCTEYTTPWSALLDDARQILEHARSDRTPRHHTEDPRSVLAGKCRAAVDGAIRQAVITRAVHRQECVNTALDSLVEAKDTRRRIAHVSTLAGGKDRLPQLDHGRRRFLEFWNKGSHGQLPDNADVPAAIDAAEAACHELGTHDWSVR
jgi:predicted ATPase